MDLMILLTLVIVVVIIFKDTKSLVYILGISDIFMRLLHFIKEQVNVEEFSALINKYVPQSLVGIIDKYSEGVFHTILSWMYIIIIAMFLFYLIKYLVKRK